MRVTKRNGALEPLDLSNIHKQTKEAVDGLGLSYEKLELNASISFTDKMKTSDVQQTLIQSALNLIDVDEPNWTFAASRLTLYDLYHSIKYIYNVENARGQVYNAVTFNQYLNFNSDILSYSIDGFNVNELNDYIEPERDKLFTYLGTKSLIERYLLNSKGKVVELPQHMFMSLAMFLASKEDVKYKTEYAKQFYDTMSKLEYLPATPTLSNGRNINGNLMSCAVGTTPDNLSGIFDAYSDQAQGSKHGTGFGWDWTRVRALGGIIGETRDAAGGLVPWMKIENDIAIAVDQLGVRAGAICVSVETWHKDIFDYLDMKRNSGEDKRLTKELFIAISASDLFMRRVEEDADFTLFDPYDVKVLTETFGDEFEEHYTKFELLYETNPELFTNEPVVIKAKDLYKKIQKYYWETGMPFWFFKDNANNAHENPELGIIRSSNLCHEIFQAATDNTTNLCNLGSINLSKINTKEQMERVIPIAMRMLDNVIDLNYYAIPMSKDNQLRTRAVGLGVAGEAELLASNHIMYGSQEHFNFIEGLYSNFQTISDIESVKLGTERGTWSLDSKYRNAYRRAIAPTSSISLIFGTSAFTEAVFNKVWTEKNNLGAFKITAPNINTDNYQYYINSYEVNQDDAIKATSIRAKYIDQGQSHNIYYRPGTTGKQVYDTIMLAWKLKLKSLYYLRSDSAQLEEIKSDKIVCFGCEG